MCFQCIQDHESVSRFLARGARRPGSERRWRGPGCGRPAPAVRALLRLALELDDGTLRLEVRQPELAVAPVAVHLHGSANPECVQVRIWPSGAIGRRFPALGDFARSSYL